MRLLGSAGWTNDETFRLGTQSGEEQGGADFADRVRRAPAFVARAGFGGTQRVAGSPSGAGAAGDRAIDSRANAGIEPHQCGLGWKGGRGVERGSEAGNFGLAFAAGSQGRFLFIAIDQRASQGFGEDAGEAVASSLFSDTREYRAASE